jgi:hypothetical protein
MTLPADYPPGRPTVSAGVSRFMEYTRAAIRFGIVCEQFKDDPTNIELVKAKAWHDEAADALASWITAVEIAMDLELAMPAGGERTRVGDPSKVIMLDEPSDADAGPVGTKRPEVRGA